MGPSKIETGVYFRTEDYGTLFRRFIVIGVDAAVMALAAFVTALIWSFITDLDLVLDYGLHSLSIFNTAYFSVCIIVWWLYLAVMKRSELRTVGYRMTGLRVVDLKGRRPSLTRMTWRFVLLIFGPFHLVFDIFWLGGDDSRQSLRDKLAKTYVVKDKAQPAGSGPVEYVNYFLLGMSFVFVEVKRPKEGQADDRP